MFVSDDVRQGRLESFRYLIYVQRPLRDVDIFVTDRLAADAAERLCSVLKQAGRFTRRLADLGWQIAGGHAPCWSSVMVLAAWTVGLTGVAALAYRRPRL